ncbi:MAG: ABC transporter substrate-binding protein [Actinomycetota bacterium]|nr:ABC transporter substrate-binding protein [Actinomycetota bacterium]
MKRLRALSRLLVVLALVGAACGDDASPGTDPGVTAGFPVEVRGVTIEDRPERIVSGSATHTEILYAIGAGERVVAIDDFSDFPSETAALPHFDAFNASVEGIAGFDPDLVILAFDPGDVASGLAALGITTIVFAPPPANLDEAYLEWLEVGAAVGAVDEAEDLVASARDDIAAIRSDVPIYVRPFAYYHELDTTYFSIGSDTFLGSIYGMLTMVSIADAAGGGFPQLSGEFIIDADPDFIFLADGETAESLAARPGWSEMSALRSGSIVELDPAIASRWGPRLVDLVALIAREVHGVGA